MNFLAHPLHLPLTDNQFPSQGRVSQTSLTDEDAGEIKDEDIEEKASNQLEQSNSMPGLFKMS